LHPLGGFPFSTKQNNANQCKPPFRVTFFLLPQTREAVTCDNGSLLSQTQETVTCDTLSFLPQTQEAVTSDTSNDKVQTENKQHRCQSISTHAAVGVLLNGVYSGSFEQC
jgi:hypothetical protein